WRRVRRRCRRRRCSAAGQDAASTHRRAIAGSSCLYTVSTGRGLAGSTEFTRRPPGAWPATCFSYATCELRKRELLQASRKASSLPRKIRRIFMRSVLLWLLGVPIPIIILLLIFW